MELNQMIREYKCNNIESCVDLAFNIYNAFPFKCWSIKPEQKKKEITELLKLLAHYKPKFTLEIGTAEGGTLFLFTKISSPEAMIISIDLPNGYPEWKIPIYESFATHNQKIHLIRQDSHASSTLNNVKKILGEHQLDFLFIDGDHTYESVKKDFKMYSPLVRTDGIIAFHDIVWGHPVNVGRVPIFWNEIKSNFNFIEIVQDWNQGGFGIGVIHV